ncbi:MAG: histidine kinase [Oleiphilus sp.]|nr:MAG: histidine kinase [Oleiphilus sp.]
MQVAEIPDNEQERLEELLKYELLDTEDEQALDELTQLASDICGVPISLISLVDEKRQWFKSRVGLDAKETSRDVAFCSHAILEDHIFEVKNALEDSRFADNPLVTEGPNIRFYAGAPLVTREGLSLGTLCVIDREPKELDARQRKALETLSKQVVRQLELRLQYRRLKRMNEEREKFYAILAHDLRSPFTGILGFSRILKESAPSLGPDKIVELSDQILNSSLTLFQLLDEILQWSQNRLGVMDCEIETHNLSELLKSSMELLDEALNLKSIRLHDSLHPALDVKVDATLTKTVFRNVLANAIKYSPKGSEITIRSRQQYGAVIVRIEDSGPGISEDLRSSLFKSSVKSGVGSEGELGSGLGLSLCYDFMAMQNGKIRLDESYTKGTAVELVLPAC